MKMVAYKTSLTLTGMILAVIGIAVIPSLFSLKKMSIEIQDAQLEIEEQYQQRQFLSHTLAELDVVRQNAALVNGYAVREGKELAFIQSLEDIALKHDVTQDLQLVTANQKTISEWETEIPLSLILIGQHSDILSLLREIESLSYYVKFKSFNIRLSGEVRDDGTEGDVVFRALGTVRWLSNASPEFVFGSPTL